MNANHKSTGIEGKNVLGKDYIKLHASVVPLLTRSLSLSLWLNPSPASNWLKFADGANNVIICTYLRSVCVKSQKTWVFEVLSFRLVMLANALCGNCKSTETESKICKQSVMQITGYNLNELWSRTSKQSQCAMKGLESKGYLNMLSNCTSCLKADFEDYKRQYR